MGAYKTTMDKLEKIIADKKREAKLVQKFMHNPASLKTHYEALEAEIKVLELADTLRPVGAASGIKQGKPQGAISKKWRRVMRAIYAEGNGYTNLSDIVGHARVVGKFRTSEVTAAYRWGQFVEAGLAEQKEGEKAFRVTKHAVEKFKLGKPIE